MKFLITQARFYQDLSDLLLQGAEQALRDANLEWDVMQVPGALEIPAAFAICHQHDPYHYQGYIALGAVIRGQTSHYDVVANQSAAALQNLSVQYGLAVGNGILTCDNHKQAMVRADPKQKNKGASAAHAAISLALLKKRINDVG